MWQQKTLYAGFAAQQFLRQKLREDTISQSDILSFKKECLLLLISVVAKIIEKCPLKSSTVKNCSSPKPHKMALEKNLVKARFKLLLDKLLDLRQLTSSHCHKAQSQLSEFLDTTVKVHETDFTSFDKKLSRLDTFYFSDIEVSKFPELAYVMKLIFTLSHGQAAVERGFIVNRYLLANNVKEKSIVSQRIIYDYMKANDFSAESIPITNMLLLSVKTSRQQQNVDLDERKKKKEESVNSRKRKTLQEEIEEVERKKSALEKLCDSLQKDFEALTDQAEKDNDMNLVVKANALKRARAEKLNDTKS